MLRANSDIREAAKEAGVFLWQIAERYGINDVNFTKKLRRELPAAEKGKIFKIIADLKNTKEREVV